VQFTGTVAVFPLTSTAAPVAVQPTASLIAAVALEDTVPAAVAGAAASAPSSATAAELINNVRKFFITYLRSFAKHRRLREGVVVVK
jgi:hypothetical protein